MSMIEVRLLAVPLLAALAAGCVTPAPPLAVTAYAAENCDSRPNLAAAASLTPERPKRYFAVTTPVHAMTPCLRGAEARTPYVVYALPAAGAARMIEVGGQIEAARIFSPTVVVLDEQGGVMRTFAADQYLYRGGVFSVQFVPQSGERFVLVTADPTRIGQRYDAIAIGTSTTTIATPYFVSNGAAASIRTSPGSSPMKARSLRSCTVPKVTGAKAGME